MSAPLKPLRERERERMRGGPAKAVTEVIRTVTSISDISAYGKLVIPFFRHGFSQSTNSLNE